MNPFVLAMGLLVIAAMNGLVLDAVGLSEPIGSAFYPVVLALTVLELLALLVVFDEVKS